MDEFSEKETEQMTALAEKVEKILTSEVAGKKIDPEVVVRGGYLGVALFHQGFDEATEEDASGLAVEAFQQAESMVEEDDEEEDE